MLQDLTASHLTDPRLFVPLTLAVIFLKLWRDSTGLARFSLGFEDRGRFLAALIPSMHEIGFVSESMAGDRMVFRARGRLVKSEVAATICDTDIPPQGAAIIVGPRSILGLLRKTFPHAALEARIGSQPRRHVMFQGVGLLLYWIVVVLAFEALFAMILN